MFAELLRGSAETCLFNSRVAAAVLGAGSGAGRLWRLLAGAAELVSAGPSGGLLG